MYMNIREKAPLLIGLGLPALFIIGVAFFVLFPVSSSLPKVSFVYTTNPSSRYELQNSLIVVSGKVAVQDQYGLFNECDTSGTIYNKYNQPNQLTIQVNTNIEQNKPDYCNPQRTDKRIEKLFSMGLKVFEHDPAKNESRELTVDEVLRLNIDDTRISRDGFEFTYGRNSGDFYGFSNDYSQDYYLKNNRYATKMDLVIPASSEYGSGVQFIGWVR